MRQKESPANQALPGSYDSTQAVARGNDLAADASQKLRSGDLQGFREDYEALRRLYHANDNLVLLAESLGGAIHILGAYRLERSDYIQLTGCMKDARRLFKRFTGSASLAENYAFLLAGVLSLKSKLGDYDDWNEYNTEFQELSRRIKDKKKPVEETIVGVTGHRDIPHAYIPRLEQSVLDLLLLIKAERREITVLSSLAEGADQLCARAALHAGCRLVVPLPMEAKEYRKDFSMEAGLEFDRLCSLAADVFVAESTEPIPVKPERGFYYRQAAIYVVKQASVLIALWDGGKTETPGGAGTYETVKLAIKKHSSIWQIVSPREITSHPQNAFTIVRYSEDGVMS